MRGPPNFDVSASGGSLTSMTSVLPATSTPLKSSQPNCGASTPYPTNTSSELLTLTLGVTRFVQATKSSRHLRLTFDAPFVNEYVGEFFAVIPTSGTFWM